MQSHLSKIVMNKVADARNAQDNHPIRGDRI